MPDFKPTVGIDLGTTFSAIAYIDEHDQPVVIHNQEGKSTTPSVVNFGDQVCYYVGDEAVKMLIPDSENTVSFIKNHMGEEGYYKKIHNDTYSPQKISAYILKKLKQDAETYFKQKGYEFDIKDAVITVPAYFGMERMSATKDAGELAGLNVLMILNEPSAAALAYGINRTGRNQRVFVFDLGRGTFDVTILEITGTDINMVAADGDPNIGGKDWDAILINYCTSIFKDKYGDDPCDDLNSYQELYEKVLSAKISLSQRDRTKIVFTHNGNKEIIEITREKFEELSHNLLDVCRRRSAVVLEKANKEWADIDTILLVGGSTYMPMIKNLIKKISGKDPSLDVNPDECVAIGAAYQARYRFIEEEVKNVILEKGENAAEKIKKELLGALPDIKIKECVAKPLGCVVKPDSKTGRDVVEIIPEQTAIPFKVSRSDFTYSEDNQTGVCVEITEGKGSKKDDVSIIGKIELHNLPPRKKGDIINITYTMTRDKIIEIEVKDVDTGKMQKGTVKLNGQMSEENISIQRDLIANQTLH